MLEIQEDAQSSPDFQESVPRESDQASEGCTSQVPQTRGGGQVAQGSSDQFEQSSLPSSQSGDTQEIKLIRLFSMEFDKHPLCSAERLEKIERALARELGSETR